MHDQEAYEKCKFKKIFRINKISNKAGYKININVFSPFSSLEMINIIFIVATIKYFEKIFQERHRISLKRTVTH